MSCSVFVAQPALQTQQEAEAGRQRITCFLVLDSTAGPTEYRASLSRGVLCLAVQKACST